ncbi:MAG TPA: apolipoprotein N-acyltransferase, partial [Bacteroidia bacterium]|nr:apolipoprotein N-acyltransferase [Bacteroidia bacterium]
MKTFRPILLSILSGLLLAAGWPSAGFAPLLLVGLVPLLHLENSEYRKGSNQKAGAFFWSVYLCFLTFNLLTTWWVRYASFFGAVAAIVCNALFMALVFQLFHKVRMRTKGRFGYLALVCFWVTFEHLHMNWDLSWPWLTLGNGFAGWPKMIQWYEFTGVLGGSIWMLAVNIFIYRLIAERILHHNEIDFRKNVILLCCIFFIPLAYSQIRYATYSEKTDPVNVAVVQPNIDPYNEKFSGMSSSDQLARIMQLASTVTDSTTDFIVAPETALPDGIWEEELEHHPHVNLLRRFSKDLGGAEWVIGLASNKLYPDSNLKSSTARRFRDTALYYDSFNTAMLVTGNGPLQLHHKSKLVPGVEKMPFPAFFKYFESFAIDLGGTEGSLGVQSSPSVF